jgi:hypothetical protein
MSMSRRLPRTSRLLSLVALVLAATSCGDAATGVVPGGPDSLLVPVVGDARGVRLLQCDPPATAQTATAIIGPLGGTLALGNTKVVIPANAVLANTSFRLTIPVSRLVEISVRAGDAEHFVFEQPVAVSIDYGRCADERSLLSPLSVWHIDESTKSLLERMASVDVRLLHTVTFSTGHLSGYAVAD